MHIYKKQGVLGSLNLVFQDHFQGFGPFRHPLCLVSCGRHNDTVSLGDDKKLNTQGCNITLHVPQCHSKQPLKEDAWVQPVPTPRFSLYQI